MLQKISIAIAIVVGITSIVVFFGLQPKSHSLEYSLSSPVTEKYDNVKDLYCQELVVTNTGKEAIRGINISIDGVITLSDKKLGFSDDVLTIINNKDSFDAKYSELGIQRSFRLAYKVIGRSLTEKDVKITYDKGTATFRNRHSENSILTRFPVSLTMLFVVIVIFSTHTICEKKLYNPLFKYIVNEAPLEKVLSTGKPMFVSDKEFSILKIEAIKAYWKKEIPYYYKLLSEIEAYKALNTDKPAYIKNDNEWNAYKQGAIESIKRFVSSSNDIDILSSSFDLQCPKFFPADSWQKNITEKAMDNYLKTQKENLMTVYWPNFTVLEELINMHDNIPITLNDSYKAKLLAFIEKYYYSCFINEIANGLLGRNELKKYFDNPILSEREKKKITNILNLLEKNDTPEHKQA